LGGDHVRRGCLVVLRQASREGTRKVERATNLDVLALSHVVALELREGVVCVLVVGDAGLFEVLLDPLPGAVLGFLRGTP